MNQKILLVDDEPDIGKLTEFLLRKSGFEVITLQDGALVFNRAMTENPDLILLDLNIPTITGKELCLKLKSDEKLKSIPVIILSASTENIRQKAEEIGADDYLMKPFESYEILGKIRSLLGKPEK